MRHGQLEDVLQYLRRIMPPAAAHAISDAELLERFVRERDEAAFELLVWRYAKMVVGVCRRVLHDPDDAEDAFQSTFLTLARRAGSIGRRASVGGWLYRVAYHTALAARKSIARRGVRERPLMDVPTPAGPATEALACELRRVLDDEVNRLAEKYRLPFILCYLEGKSNAEAARELGCALGTIASRLARARQRLRIRLTRRGLSLPGGVVATVLAWQGESTAVPFAIVHRTSRAATLFARDPAAATGVVSTAVVALTKGVLRGMFLSKLKLAAVLCVALGAFGMGLGTLGYPALAAKPREQRDARANRVDTPREQKPEAAQETQENGVIKELNAAQHTMILQPPPQRFKADLHLQTSVYDVPLYSTINIGERRLQLASQVTVLIDGKEARLSELTPQTPVEVTRQGRLVTRIVATGSTMEWCYIQAADLTKHTLKVRHFTGNIFVYDFAKDVEVIVDDQKGALAELTADMPVRLQFSAVKPNSVIGIRADGATLACVVRAVDAERHTITVLLPRDHLIVPNLRVADNAPIQIDGKAARLADLKPGARGSLHMAADPEKSLVLSVRIETGKEP